MGLATVLGFARRGFFIPHRYAADLPMPGCVDPYDALIPLFDRRRAEFAALVGEIDALAGALEAIDGGPGNQPRWSQGWFPRLDAAAAYAMVRRLRPGRIVEVGSGHSTRFILRAISDGSVESRVTSIDPAPRAATDGLDLEHIPCKVHEIGIEMFAALGPGDILFIDSSHILMPGTDVDFLVNRVWPVLAPGVVVHFHDIFLPDDYPRLWAWRGYNEQLAVAPLIASGDAELMFSSHYVTTRMCETLADTVVSRLPIMHGAIESSLWIEKRGRAAEAATK